MLNKPNHYNDRSLARDEFSEFLKGFREYEKSFLIKEKEDLLLDAYSKWLKAKEEKAKLRVMRLALELELLGEHINVNKLFSHNLESSITT